MSRQIDINQLLEEIGTSARSADDPWTLSRNNRGTDKRDAFSPSVVGDLGAPLQNLTSGIQSSEQISYADTIAPGLAGGSGTGTSSTGGGILGGLLNFFPLASGIAKLFGFGGSSSPPALTPYQLPPSISFEGAMSSPTSGVTSLSYGSDGLPRTSTTPQGAATSLNTPSISSFAPIASHTVSNIAGQSFGQNDTNTSANVVLSSLANSSISNLQSGTPSTAADPTPAGTSFTNGSTTGTNIVSQLSTLANSDFQPEPSATNPSFNSGFISNVNTQNSDAGSVQNLSGAQNPVGGGSMGTSANSTSSQQGQSILVQVQAMDSQSFMDHSQEIAQAVRQAMLNMNSLNDVILDL